MYRLDRWCESGHWQQKNEQTNKHNNDLLEKDGGTKNCIYKD